MNRTRTLVLLTLGIVLVVGLQLLVDIQTASAPRSLRRHSLLSDGENFVALEIRRGNDPATVLSCDPDWKITSPCAAPADRAVVLQLLDALAFAPTRDEMTDAELLRLGRTRADFGLEPPRIRVSAARPDGARTTIAFGDVTPTSDGVYAALDAGDTVYVVPTNVWTAVNRDMNGFRQRNFFACTSDQVRSVDVKGATEHFMRLTREDDAWKITEPYACAAVASRVQAFLVEMLTLRAQDFVWPVGGSNEMAVASASLLAGYGLDAESAVTVTIKCVDGTDLMVSFGRRVGRDQLYAQMPNGAIAIVSLPTVIRSVQAAGVAAFVDTRLFPLDGAAVSKISLEDEGTTYLLSRETGGSWRLDTPVSAAADPEQVANFLNRLLSLRTADADAAGITVSLNTNAEPVAVSRAALLKDLRLEDLRAREILRLNPLQIKRLVVTEGDGRQSAVVFDAESRVWTMENAQGTSTVDREAVERLVAAINPLKAARIERIKVSATELGLYGLDKPLRTVAIDQISETSVRRNIRIGDVTSGGRYATAGSSDAVFVLAPESASALLAPIVK